MKNVFVFSFIFFSISLFAQQTEGTIFYTESIKLDIELPEGQEHLRAMIPSSSDITKALHFTSEQSMYKDIDGSDGTTEISEESDGTQMQVKIISGSADNRLLKNLSDQKFVNSKDFLGKKFLIKGDLEPIKWKITGEQKQILDFVCQKATYTKDTTVVEAWFTPQIPIANGPDMHDQLPGMILMVSMEDGKRTITATEVKFEQNDPSVFEEPTKGKKVSRSEFREIQKEKMQEMGGGNGRTVIRMEIDDRG